jgi:predicted DNA-binding transcriptional regulator AlpA
MKELKEKPLLSAKEVRAIFGNISVKTELIWRQKNILPQPVELAGSRLIFYKASEIEAIWNEQQGKKGGHNAK